MQRFKIQVAIISGGPDGLGKGIAERNASEDGKVVLFDINKTLLEQTVNKFKNKGFIADGYVADISSESSVQRAIQKVEDKLVR